MFFNIKKKFKIMKTNEDLNKKKEQILFWTAFIALIGVILSFVIF